MWTIDTYRYYYRYGVLDSVLLDGIPNFFGPG